jgi:PAS domain S-box-containing protein
MSNIKTSIEPSLSSLSELQTELALKDLIFDATSEAIFVLNPDGTIYGLNGGVLQVFGYAREALVGRDFSERVISPVCQESYRVCFDRLVETGSGPFHNRRVELSATRSDRTEIPIEFSIKQIRLEGRSHFVASIRDVSESKRIETLLRESEARFRRLFESNMMGVFFWDIHGNISEANESFLKTLGYTRKDLAGGKLRWKGMSPRTSEHAEKRAADELARTGICTPYEKEYFHKDGHRIPVLTASAFFDGSQTRGASIIQEISTQKNELLRVRESNLMLSAILEQSPDPIYVKDNYSKIRLANEALARIFNRPLAELIGKSEADFFDSEIAERIYNDDQKVLETGETSFFELEVKLDPGSKSVLVTKNPYRDSEGRITGIVGTFRDLTDQKRQEHELKTSRSATDLIAQGVAEAVIVSEPFGKVTFTNRAAEKMFGLSGPAPSGSTLKSLRERFVWLNADGHPCPEDRLPDSQVSRGSSESEILLRFKPLKATSGSLGSSANLERWVVLRSSPIRNSENQLVAILSIYREVTENRKLEDLARQQSAAMKASIDGLAVLNSRGEFVYVNDPCALLYGLSSSQELVGKTWECLFNPSDYEKFTTEVLSKVDSLGHWRGETVGRKSDGTSFYKEMSISQMSHGGLVCVIRDISDTKRATESQRILDIAVHSLGSSLDYRKTLESFAQVVIGTIAEWCVIDILEADHSITRVLALHRDSEQSGRMEALLTLAQGNLQGSHRKAMIMKTGTSFIYPDEASLLAEPFLQSESIKLHQELKAGSALVVPLIAHGKTLGAITMVRSREETAYRREDLILAEELAQRAAIFIDNARLYEKAQNAITARNDFVAMVSHDLKNPLSAILLNTAFILRNFRRDPEITNKDRHLQKQIEALDRSAQRMNSLIADFLDLARIESGKLVVEKRGYRVQSLIHDAIEMMTPLALEKSIDLTRTSEIVAFSAFFDRERLFQVLSNLLGNAIKFTPPGGQVRIGVYLDAHVNSGELVFVIQDSGPGIPGHQRPHIFDRYWQAQDNYRGSAGLGLSICKGIVEAHGGRIWVESSPGEGSTFCFSIPHPVTS